MALTDNLLAYWKLDESSGNAADATGNGHTLTNNGSLTYSACKINNGAVLSATGPKYLNATDSGLQISTGDFSFSLWLKTTATVASPIGRRYSTGGDWINYNLYFNGTRIVWYETSNTSGDYGRWDATDTLATMGILDDNWHHIVYVGTFGNDASHKLYIDNTEKSGSWGLSGSKSGMNKTSASFGLGDPLTSSFNGSIDEVGIWTKILTTTEISSLYNSGAGFAYPFTETAKNPSIESDLIIFN